MVNIEKITSTLAKLPDQALQRYAMMHKDDPYIVALAVSESNRRKDMRAAGQAQPMQQQPKVVDQAVAEMAPQQMPAMPEEQGIGALPAAQQMEFADGGITGYAGGGEVERYQDRGLVRPYETVADRYYRQTREAEAAAQAEREAQAAAIGVTPYDQQMRGLGSAIANIPGVVYDAAGTALKTLVSAPGYGLSNFVDSPKTPTAAQGAPTYKPEDASGMDRRLAATGATPPMAANATKEVAGGAGSEGARNLGAGTRELGAGAPRAAAPSTQSIEDRFLAAQKRMTEQANPFQTQEDALTAEQKKFAEEKLAAVTERNEKFKDAFKGREGRIEERAKELEKSKDTNTGLAFLEAGLAIMSTPGGLGTAIGKGAREGTAKYAAGIEKLRSAKEKLDEARDRMEELKLNRDEMSAKEIMEAKLGIQQAVLSGKKDALSSAKTLYGDRSALAQTIVKETLNAEEKAKDRATQVQTAGAAASIALGPQNKFIDDWLSKPENKGKSYSDAYTAFKNTAIEAKDPQNRALLIQKYADSWNKMEPQERINLTKQGITTREQYIDDMLRISGLSGGTPPPASGKVPPLPSGYKLN